jgi:hypothetical protein
MIDNQSINGLIDGTNPTARPVHLFGGLTCKVSPLMHEYLWLLLLATFLAVGDDLFPKDRRRSVSSDQRGQSLCNLARRRVGRLGIYLVPESDAHVKNNTSPQVSS